MDMMINSIYTNKEIFLRELISNASDAIDKLYYKSLTDTSVGMNKSDFRILITRDKENRILTVEDNGIGMTKAELEEPGHHCPLRLPGLQAGQQGREHRHHRPVRRRLLLLLHGGRQGHRHLKAYGSDEAGSGVLRCGRLRDDPG